MIDPALAAIVQGTIASAAVINEIFAVILAKIALKKAGEIPSNKDLIETSESNE